MNASQLKLTYIGGPTALLEFGGLRPLTDPTFDAPGGEYTTGPVTLRKIMGPALGSDAIGLLDAVLLTHDHHFDNLDHAGRALLGNMERVFTTKEGTTAGAERHWLCRLGQRGFADSRRCFARHRHSRTTRACGFRSRPGHWIHPCFSTHTRRRYLYKRRYSLVRRRGRGRTPLRDSHGCPIHGCGASSGGWFASSDHDGNRRHPSCSRVSPCDDRAAAFRRLGSFFRNRVRSSREHSAELV